MSSKPAILARIREALKIAAPLPVAHELHHDGHDHAPTGVQGADLGSRRAWLPPVPADFEGQVALFAKNSGELKTDFRRVPDQAALENALRELAKTGNWQRVATHGGQLTDRAVAALAHLPQKPLRTDQPYAAPDLERCDAGITECDCLVAQTGTIVLTTKTAGGRALSVLPEHHVVVARLSQLVPDLLAAFELLQQRHGSNYPSFMTLITGPSRTGDIERILVLGAHGPKKLTILALE